MGNDLRQARNETGLSRQDIEDKYGIPLRSLTNWEGGVRECPKYVHDLLIDIYNREKHMAVISYEKEWMDPISDEPLNGYSCYIKSRNEKTGKFDLKFSWFYPVLSDGKIDALVLQEIKRMSSYGWNIVFK